MPGIPRRGELRSRSPSSSPHTSSRSSGTLERRGGDPEGEHEQDETFAASCRDHAPISHPRRGGFGDARWHEGQSRLGGPPPTPRMQLDSWTPLAFRLFRRRLTAGPRLDGRWDDWTPAHLPVAHLLRQRDLARVAHGRRKQSQGAAALPLRDVGVHQRHTHWRPSASRSRWRRSRCLPCVHCGEDRPARRCHRVPRRERDRWRHLPSPWARARLSCRIPAP